MAIFFCKNSSKILWGQTMNMKETLHWSGILGKSFLQVFSTSVHCFRYGNFLLFIYFSKNSSKMHSWSVIMGSFWPTGMPHRVA